MLVNERWNREKEIYFIIILILPDTTDETVCVFYLKQIM